MRGLHPKYVVHRTDGGSAPGERHERCIYFVLDLEHDEHAIAALKAYAKAVEKENPALAADLDAVIANVRVRCGCREAFCPHTPAFAPDGHSEMAAYVIAQNERKP